MHTENYYLYAATLQILLRLKSERGSIICHYKESCSLIGYKCLWIKIFYHKSVHADYHQ